MRTKPESSRKNKNPNRPLRIAINVDRRNKFCNLGSDQLKSLIDYKKKQIIWYGDDITELTKLKTQIIESERELSTNDGRDMFKHLKNVVNHDIDTLEEEIEQISSEEYEYQQELNFRKSR